VATTELIVTKLATVKRQTKNVAKWDKFRLRSKVKLREIRNCWTAKSIVFMFTWIGQEILNLGVVNYLFTSVVHVTAPIITGLTIHVPNFTQIGELA